MWPASLDSSPTDVSESGEGTSRGPPPRPAAEGHLPGARSPSGEARKTVTVVFSDVAESTRLGAELDPEAVGVGHGDPITERAAERVDSLL